MNTSYFTSNCTFKSGVSGKIETKKKTTDYALVASRLKNTDSSIINNIKKCSNSKKNDGVVMFDIPDKIVGTYKDNYNIINIDEIIRKKLNQEKHTILNNLKIKYENLELLTTKPQNYIMRETTIKKMEEITKEIIIIEEGKKLTEYNERSKNLIVEYKKYNGLVKTVTFDMTDDDQYYESDNVEFKDRINIIEKYIEIASDYINLSIIKINNHRKEICCGCGESLTDIFPDDNGFVRCPNVDCQTENIAMLNTKIINDGGHSAVNNVDSIDNFLKAFFYYQGLQSVKFPDNLFDKLDNHFRNMGRKSGDEIKKLPINSRGKRGDTDHKMIWSALCSIGYSEFYKHSNYICYKYWGWELPNVMHLKDTIIYYYNVIQKIYNNIPVDERGRDSSLGIPFLLWRLLQLAGHECYFDEFKIVTNVDSLHLCDTLWERTVNEANKIDASIYYIPI